MEIPIEVPNMRRFANIKLISDWIPDPTMVLNFSHLLEKHALGKQNLKADLSAQGIYDSAGHHCR